MDPVYLVSPSSAVPEDAPWDLALSQLRLQGWHPVIDRDARKRHLRFAGTDRQRAAAICRAATQSQARMVMMTRGGYGWMRLLPHLDLDALAEAGKFWVGFSDATAFHLAMFGHSATQTWAGPAMLDDFARESLDETTCGCLRNAYQGELKALGFAVRGQKRGQPALEERGPLWGGNLSMVCAMLGSRWLPKAPSGGIFFLEDAGEHPYRIERMLLQLLYSGVIDAQKAVLLGGFNQYRLSERDRGYDLKHAIEWIRKQTNVPILEGLPFGHTSVKLTLPHGRRIGLATEAQTAYLLLEDD
jgi:muramoyltetrapeptide carboxypeptidase